MKRIYFATNGDSESKGFYDENCKLIYAWQDGDDITFPIRELFKRLGIEFIETHMPEPDGAYPEKI